MKQAKKQWVSSAKTSVKLKVSEADQKILEEYFQPMVESFKIAFISKDPDKEFNYTVDIYSKWYRDYFYLCQQFKSEHPNRRADEFEVKFTRLQYVGKNQFDFSYFRHTGQWHVVARGLSMEECREMILSNPVFQPIWVNTGQ